MMARCDMCGAELHEASERFCGGDRCRRAFMKRPEQSTRAIAARAHDHDRVENDPYREEGGES
jgi:hypothetical protein